MLPLTVFFIILSYLVGSLASAIIVCRMLGLPNPREAGSGNPGTTNVLRIGGKKAALLTLVGDMLKGFLPVLAAILFGLSPLMISVCALAAFLGHLYPIFFKFKGGKGVATYLGVALALAPGFGGMMVLTWLIVAILFRYSSLAALVSASLAPLFAFWLLPIAMVPAIVIMTGLLLWKHQENIRNLRSGHEDKITF